MKLNEKIIILFFCVLVCGLLIYNFLSYEDSQVTPSYVVTKHDWECNYVIVDSFTVPDKTIYHYIDEYETNEEGAISFVSHDGLFTMIPRNYFRIIINDNI